MMWHRRNPAGAKGTGRKDMAATAQKQDRGVARAHGRTGGPRRSAERVFGHRPLRRMAVVAAMLAAFATSPAESSGEGDNLVRVLAVVPHRQTILSEESLTGTIAAQIESVISFQTPGRVTQRLVEVGQHVTAGQVLARLDPTDQQADVASAEAHLNSANAQLREAQITF